MMIKSNRKQLLLSSAVTLLPMGIGLLLWNRLPEYMNTHWGADGVPDGRMWKGWAVFGIPLLMLAIQWLCIWITARDPKNRVQNNKVFRMVLWIIPIVSLTANGVILSVGMGKSFDAMSIPILLIGGMFVVIGNYLPKCRQNRTIGIKVKWTLANEENWNATHRFAGKVWVIGGLVILLSVFFPQGWAPMIVLAGIVGLALIPVIYSRWYYRKQADAGKAPVKAVVPMDRFTRIFSTAAVGVALVIAAVCIVICFTGNIDADFGENALTLRADYWTDLTVAYADIEQAEYRAADVPGERMNGFGTPRLMMGWFRNPEFGDYTRYTYTGQDACIVLKTKDETIVVGGRTAAQTQALWAELQKRVGRP